MVYTPALDCAPTDLEARMGIASMEALHAQRREIMKRLSPLKFLYGGSRDQEDAERKRHRDLIERLLREELPDGADMAKGRIESLANSDPRHITFCAQLKDGFIEYGRWETCLKEIEEIIAAREYESRYITKELGLQP